MGLHPILQSLERLGLFGGGAIEFFPIYACRIEASGETHGADPQLRSDFDDMTPLQAALRHGRSEFVALLRARGAREERKPFWWRWLPV